MSNRRKPKLSQGHAVVGPTSEVMPPQPLASADLLPEFGQPELAIGLDVLQCAASVDAVQGASVPTSGRDDEVRVTEPLALSFAAQELTETELRATVESLDAIRAEPLLQPAGEEMRQTLGERFRAIRESRGVSREEMSRRLRVAPSVIDDIESDHWERLGAPVYVRGHLNSYAKTLNVPAVVVSLALRDLNEPAPLTLTVAASAPATLWSRYSSAATYVVLTLLLAIPIFTMLDQRGIYSPVPQVRSMADSEVGPVVKVPQQPLLPPAPVPGLPGPTQRAQDGVPTDSATAQQSDTMPLMASMTPMGAMNAVPDAEPGAHRIEMMFSQDSWVETIDGAGARLDYGIARAGERREHRVNGTVTMSIGNVNGVELQVDGKRVDLLQFARLNVARLKLFETDSHEVEPTSAAPSR